MKTRWIKKSLFGTAAFALLVAWVSPPSWCEDKWPPIRTTTGVIMHIDRQGVILLDSVTYYPSPEAMAANHYSERRGIPDWVKLDNRVGISYYEERGRRFYLDIVEPGEPFLIKEGVEEDRKTLSPL